MAVILLFMTSPGVILNLISDHTFLGPVINTQRAEDTGPTTEFIFLTALPALLVIGVNELLLLLIDIVIDFEDHHRFSRDQ